MSRRSRPFFDDFRFRARRVALVGLHGQTILHRPRAGLTRQLCDGARAAAALEDRRRLDFRSADVAAGGEGAPLAPIYHAAMAAGLRASADDPQLGRGRQRHLSRRRGRDHRLRHRPGQCADRRFSPVAGADWPSTRTARWRRAGASIAPALAALMRDPYFDRPAPKSLDRNHFSAAAACVERLSDADGAATLERLHGRVDRGCAEACPAARRRAGWSGAGGRRNPILMRRLGERLQVSGRAGRGDRLRRRQHRSAMFRLSRAALAARPADLVSDDDRRAEADDRRASSGRRPNERGPACARP